MVSLTALRFAALAILYLTTGSCSCMCTLKDLLESECRKNSSAMAEVKEARLQITPETPGRATVLNPFDSPSDYCNLQDPIFSSPTVFKSSKSSLTPGKFRWSIDELAKINPVEIDPEDIHRQALYLSHIKIDKEIEDRRQKAIEEFFTKRIIVPSPWMLNEGKKISHFHSTNCIDLSLSPIGKELIVQPGKSSGDHFKADENADQSQENLSSSSLRRKLFLDGSGSRCSSPSHREGLYDTPAISLGVLCSIDLSPVRCRSPMETPSSGQFSSSPIQGGRRAHSLGSITSPMFPRKSPPSIASPTCSPISVQRDTPASGQKMITFHSPDVPSASSSSGSNPYAGSPYIDGGSPVKNFFPKRSGTCRGSAQYKTSIFQIPFPLEHYENEHAPSPEALLPQLGTAVHLQQLTTTCSGHLVMETLSAFPEQSNSEQRSTSLLNLEELKDNTTIDMVDPVEIGDVTWAKEDNGNSKIPMCSFMTGITFSIESSHMCLSPLAESSVIPCDSSIQVDSGYNTQTGGNSIMDGIVSESSGRETDLQICEIQNKLQPLKSKELPALEFDSKPLLGREFPERISSTDKAPTYKPFSLSAFNCTAQKATGEQHFNKLYKNARIHNLPRILDGKSASCFMEQSYEIPITKR
ncbi:protein aurora borealis isoform X2 [Rhinatrema bivittatum]|uniref:protein aurora borealis isoform X2 n=1 Tax=Rhinatrema bivittatum TaxID=194408 RepID=UPI00112960EF|nr:protein aurora borealis isoform X2 [Rhinatrema bivittatum]